MAGVLEIVIILVILYCVFNSRASAMVDVLSARLQAVYTNWDRGPESSPTKKVSATTLRRFAPAEKREKMRALSADNLQQYRDRALFRTKDSSWVFGFPPRSTRPITGLACKACTPDSKDFSFDYTTKHQEVQNILKTDTEHASSFFTRAFCHIIHIWRFKKFDFSQVSDKVLKSDILRNAIEETTREVAENSSKEETRKSESYSKIYKNQEKRARKILMDMRSTLNDCLLRIVTWVMYKILPRFLTSVCLHPSHLAMIQKAAGTNLPLIFVPLHRSHMDYILITFILQNIRVKSPLVAAGNNLKIPVFGWLLRGLGAFFIKRRIDPVDGGKDILYRAVLQSYMIECLRAGHNIEFYIEGGRTRTGKPCMPKGGLLSVIVGAYMDGTIEDALLVPVSVNYDKLVEGNFVSELLGQPKQMETFSKAISSIWKTLNSNHGSIRIDFNQPFSLRELVKSFQSRSSRLSQSDIFSSNGSDSSSYGKRNGLQKERSFRSIPSTTSLYGTDVVDENHRALVDKIGRHLVYDCSKACAIMSTNTLAFLLLNKYREGVPLNELIKSFDKLRQQLCSDNRDVGYSGATENVVEHAIRILGPEMVKRESVKDPDNPKETVDFITPVTTLQSLIDLSYYSNTLTTHFVMEGVVATSICSCAKLDGNLSVGLDDIMKNALDLCDILQFEFIFSKPCETLEYIISETVDKFKYMDILTTQEPVNLEYEDWSQKVARSLEDSEDDEFYQYKPCPTYTVRFPKVFLNDSKGVEEKLELFHMILRPLLDSYVATAMCLRILVNKEMIENEFVKKVLAEIKSQLLNGYFSYGESSSVDAIKNSLKLFKKWGVIDMYNKFQQSSVRVVSLAESYNGEEELQPILRKINHFKLQSYPEKSEVSHN